MLNPRHVAGKAVLLSVKHTSPSGMTSVALRLACRSSGSDRSCWLAMVGIGPCTHCQSIVSGGATLVLMCLRWAAA